MTAVEQAAGILRPDVDLTDGRFYAGGGARKAYRWVRGLEPL